MPNRANRTPSPAPLMRYHGDVMPLCRECQDEVDELFTVKIQGRRVKLCEDCADRAREEAEIAEESEAVVQQMMGFKGRR